MTLAQLFFAWPEIQKHFSSEMTVLGLTTDTRKVQPGFVFIAVRGLRHDGHDYLSEAAQKGALALVVQNRDKVPSEYKGFVLCVEETRKTLDFLAGVFYTSPSSQTFNIGVTGTNGKTSVTHMIEKIFTDQGKKCAVLGTIDHHLGHLVFPTDLTTPGPVELQARLREFVDAGAEVLSMEVSSHSLDQHRVDSVQWNAAVFTNLTQDHLDYHGTMENYFLAKEKLFRERLPESPKPLVWAVINMDDVWGRRIRLPDRVGLLTYGLKEGDLRASIKKMDFSGTEVDVYANGKVFPVQFQFIGKHNVLNALAALGASLTALVPFERALRSLSEYLSVPGRLERVRGPQGKNFFVDYAHTPDALENVLQTLKAVADGEVAQLNQESRKKIHVVFGCGGDRDRSKRPLMYKVAQRYADFIYVTSDNPRTEEPQSIIAEILSVPRKQIQSDGFWFDEKTFVHPDRKWSIKAAAEKAEQGDVILVAGKGHEEYQILGQEKLPFSDRQEIEKLR